MRPRHFAVDDSRVEGVIFTVFNASMRPRHFAVDDAMGES